MIKALQTADTNQDGVVSREELIVALAQVAKSSSNEKIEEDVDQLLIAFDRDGNGVLDKVHLSIILN